MAIRLVIKPKSTFSCHRACSLAIGHVASSSFEHSVNSTPFSYHQFLENVPLNLFSLTTKKSDKPHGLMNKGYACNMKSNSESKDKKEKQKKETPNKKRKYDKNKRGDETQTKWHQTHGNQKHTEKPIRKRNTRRK